MDFKRKVKMKNEVESGIETKMENDVEKDIMVVDNNIYYYGDVNKENVMLFNTKLKTLETDMKVFGCRYGITPEINVFIQSDGGDVYYGLSAMDHIYECEVHVNTIADGSVCSAGTFLLMGGHSRYIMKHTSVLIHQIRTEFWGKYDELMDEKVNSDKCMEIVKTIYKENSKMKDKKLNNLLKRELYLTAEECINEGIVDDYYQVENK